MVRLAATKTAPCRVGRSTRLHAAPHPALQSAGISWLPQFSVGKNGCLWGESFCLLLRIYWQVLPGTVEDPIFLCLGCSIQSSPKSDIFKGQEATLLLLRNRHGDW